MKRTLILFLGSLVATFILFQALDSKRMPYGEEENVHESQGDPNKMVEIFDYIANKIVALKPVVKSESAWQEQMSDIQYQVTRRKGTERAFTGKLYKENSEGLYRCVGCGTDLFHSSVKYDSGCGWPSFWQPVADANVALSPDHSFNIERTEVKCVRCGAHLGHLFEDGPRPTGLRYCINSASLEFTSASQLETGEDKGSDQDKKPAPVKQATFAAGCFWGIEVTYAKVDGVLSTAVGYMGGYTVDPTYKQVCSGDTNHAEVIHLTYDPDRVSYEKLLDIFFENHDPTTLNRQGPDVGSQYRSAVFYHSEEQRDAALAKKAALEKQNRFSQPIVTEITAAAPFYRAEEYHQRYLEKRGLASCGRE